MTELRCKVLIVGGGPAGYVAAIRAGELGLDTVLVEDGQFGGTCLHVGCIPSKAIIHAADAVHALTEPRALNAIGVSLGQPALDYAKTVAWKDAIVSRLSTGVGALLKKAQVRSLRGRATIVDGKSALVRADTGDQRIQCEHLVIATGSEPWALAAIPFGGDVLSSTEALALTKVPQTLAVVGAGYIGMELGMAFAKLGAKVTIVEALQKILPLYDEELTQPVARRLADLGVETMLGARALGFAAGALKVAGADGAERAIAADKVLVAVGRRARTTGFGLEGLDLTMAGPFLRIDDRCATSMRNVWAIGDVTGEADARPSRHGAGRNGRRDHRGREARLRPPRHPGDLLHRPGDRRGRARAGRCQSGARRDHRRPFPLPRQRPGDDQTGGRGLRARRRARRQSRRARHSGRRRRTSPNSRPPFRWRSKWARGSRTSPARSTPIRRRARRSTRRR